MIFSKFVNLFDTFLQMQKIGMEPREESNGSRPDSPQSDDSSSESDLSSPSFNRDINFASTKDIIEAEPSRDTILNMAPLSTGFENEPDAGTTGAANTNLSQSIDLIDNNDRKSRVLPKSVSFSKTSSFLYFFVTFSFIFSNSFETHCMSVIKNENDLCII